MTDSSLVSGRVDENRLIGAKRLADTCQFVVEKFAFALGRFMIKLRSSCRSDRGG